MFKNLIVIISVSLLSHKRVRILIQELVTLKQLKLNNPLFFISKSVKEL